MNWQSIFRVAIRIVFLFAFAAFLFASIRHVATFFHNFEGEKEDWVNPFMLAISIDATALMLTIGVMFFSRGMPWYAKTVTWLFIIGLTGFSWIVNWEYARTFQGTDLKTGNFLHMLNPVLASSFAFLNLAYSVVAEFFDTKGKTADELVAEAERLEDLEAAQKRIDAYRARNKKKSFIQSAKETLIEAKDAVKEVRNGETKPADEIASEAQIDEPITETIIDFLPLAEEDQSEQYNDEDNGVDNDEDNDLTEVLEGYPKVSTYWLAKGRKSASIDEIIEVTGHSKRRLNKANLQRSSRNRDLILISSVIDWLKTAPKPRDADPLPAANGHIKITQPLDKFVQLKV